MLLSAVTFKGVSYVMICMPAATEEQSCQSNISKSMLLPVTVSRDWVDCKISCCLYWLDIFINSIAIFTGLTGTRPSRQAANNVKHPSVPEYVWIANQPSLWVFAILKTLIKTSWCKCIFTLMLHAKHDKKLLLTNFTNKKWCILFPGVFCKW